MRRALVLAAGALLTGCLGPLLPLPQYPHLAHEWLCVNRACPDAALADGGVVVGAKYEPSIGKCMCLIDDARHLFVYEYPDPHRR